jgi:hypothetical protein
MDPIEAISRAQTADLVDEDGKPVTLALEPGLRAARDRGTRGRGRHRPAGRAAAPEHDDFEIVDLRHADIGMGFSWGRHGPRTEVRRHGHELLFAYRPPPRRPRRRLFSRR